MEKTLGEIPALHGNIPFLEKSITLAAGAQDGDITIEGWANKAIRDRVGDIVDPSAFKASINTYLNNPILLYMHDKKTPIGSVTDISVKEDGIYVKAYITAASKFAREEVIPLVKQKILNSFSIGFIPKDGRYEPKSESYIITKGELLELSVVSVPANPDAIFSVSKDFNESKEFEDLRNTWKQKAVEPTIDPATAEKLTNKIEETRQMDEKIKELENLIASLTKAVETKNDTAATAELDSLKKKAAEYDALQAEMAKKAAAEADAARTAELEATKKALDETTAKIKDFDTVVTALKTELEETKAVVAKGGRRIEFPSVDANAIWKDYGEELDNLFVLRDINSAIAEKSKFYNDLPEQVKTVSLDAAFRTLAGKRIWADIRANAIIAGIIPQFELPTDIYNLPWDASNMSATWVNAGATSSTTTLTIKPVAFQAKKLMVKCVWNYEDEADALVPVIPQIRYNLINAMTDELDTKIMAGTGTPFRGLEHWAARGGGTQKFRATITAGNRAKVTAADVQLGRIMMGKYGYKNSDTVFLCNFLKYAQLVNDANVLTVDKFGPMATIHQGELAKVMGMPIVVSDKVTGSDTASSGLAGTLAWLPGFLLGYRNNMTVESFRDVELQTNVLVFTIRVDFKPVIPVDSNSELPYAGEGTPAEPKSYPIVYSLLNNST